MKVTKSADTSWSYSFTCGTCCSELEAETSDLRCNFDEGYAHGPDFQPETYTYYLTCPVCQNTHYVKEDEIPQAVRFVVPKH